MPRMDGTGPGGMGPMTGWGHGFCGHGFRAGAVAGCGYGFGRGRGRGPGFGGDSGRGWGRGNGPGFGWYSVGYGPEAAAPDPAEGLRASLEARKAFLRAELARTEALLAENRAEEEPKDSTK